MKVIKRNGEEVQFDSGKIVNAVNAANMGTEPIHRLNEYQVQAIADTVEGKVQEMTHIAHVEDIQDMVETGIMEMRGYEVAQKYVRYRYKRELTRKSNTTDNGILSLIEHLNETVNQENSNKNPVINSTQRDYMAGEVSKDLTMRVLLPEEIVKAHEEGIIHFHDSDYYAQKEHNCDLINLEDMLQNGTVISETMIEKPHSFFTACNVTTQIVAQVASNQYGGQTFTLSHLAPFVDISRQKIRSAVVEERTACGDSLDPEIVEKIVENRLKGEIRSGIQTIQYQLITLMTCNGQAPFVTMFMYLDEVPEGKLRDDLAMLIEEVLHQRMQGVKNEKGIWITPAFPKLVYVLDEDNITSEAKYWYLTELAAKCTAKRLVPDYISAKIMRTLKKGDVYPCMGCRSFPTVEDNQRNPDHDQSPNRHCNNDGNDGQRGIPVLNRNNIILGLGQRISHNPGSICRSGQLGGAFPHDAVGRLCNLSIADLVGNGLGHFLPSICQVGIAGQNGCIAQGVNLCQFLDCSIKITYAFRRIRNKLIDFTLVHSFRIIGQHCISQISGGNVALQAAVCDQLLRPDMFIDDVSVGIFLIVHH